MIVPGTLEAGTDKAAHFRALRAVTITEVYLEVKTAPTGAAIIVDVNKNGTTLFTTQSNRPQIAISATTGTSTTIENNALAAGDLLVVDLDQVGSTIAGADLSVHIRGRKS